MQLPDSIDREDRPLAFREVSAGENPGHIDPTMILGMQSNIDPLARILRPY
jgi:hypothetical protein